VFHGLSPRIQAQMKKLEQIDAQDRKDNISRLKRLRQIPPQTGKFLALLASSSPHGQMIEIGTSAGYSTLWLSLAAKETGRSIVTFELLEEKARLARETFKATQLEQVIDLVVGDALDHLGRFQEVAFCFLDAEKEIYQPCYDAVVPNLVRGGLLVADNAINHRERLESMIERSLGDERVDAMVAPIGKGLLLCRKV